MRQKGQKMSRSPSCALSFNLEAAPYAFEFDDVLGDGDADDDFSFQGDGYVAVDAAKAVRPLLLEEQGEVKQGVRASCS